MDTFRPMKLIIAGSRHLTGPSIKAKVIMTLNHYASVRKIIPTEIVCGMADGIDTIGCNIARENNIPVKEFPANWKKYGRTAGPIRNREMAEYADACFVFYDGKSIGSKNMIKQAKELKLDLWIVLYNKGNDLSIKGLENNFIVYDEINQLWEK